MANILNELDLIEMFRVLPPTTAEDTFFLN